MDQTERTAHVRVCNRGQPSRLPERIAREPEPNRLDYENVGEACDHGIRARLHLERLFCQQRDDRSEPVAGACAAGGNRKYPGKECHQVVSGGVFEIDVGAKDHRRGTGAVFRETGESPARAWYQIIGDVEVSGVRHACDAMTATARDHDEVSGFEPARLTPGHFEPATSRGNEMSLRALVRGNEGPGRAEFGPIDGCLREMQKIEGLRKGGDTAHGRAIWTLGHYVQTSGNGGKDRFGQVYAEESLAAPMKKIIQRSFGGPEVLELVEADKPQPLPTEVLVRAHATSINPVEAFIRGGHFPLIGQPPFTLGWDVSGVVEEVVPGTYRFKVGDEVYGMPFFPRAANAYAEYIVAPSRQLALKPRNLSHTQAAAIPLAGLSAWQALVDWGEIKRGQRVLIHGGAGGVGHLAVQLAKHFGAFVIATASQSKHPYLQSLGVDQLIDYKTTDFTQVVRDVDLVLDVIGSGYAQRSFEVLKPGGLLVTAVERTSTELPKLAASLGRRFGGLGVEPDYYALEKLAALVEKGELVPHVEKEFSLADIGEAHTAIETGSTMGKIAIRIRQE